MSRDNDSVLVCSGSLIVGLSANYITTGQKARAVRHVIRWVLTLHVIYFASGKKCYDMTILPPITARQRVETRRPHCRPTTEHDYWLTGIRELVSSESVRAEYLARSVILYKFRLLAPPWIKYNRNKATLTGASALIRLLSYVFLCFASERF